jgi:sulfatase maturation enzyme AslB (radical SAM superfamily)
MAQLTHRAARSCPVHGAASGAVDKLFHARLHLSQRFDCPIKRDHFFTGTCNFACTYCYDFEKDRFSKQLSGERVKEIIPFFRSAR